MTTYTFPSYPAIDPTTETLVRGASGQVYDINDTSGTTPLSVTDLNGLPLSEIKTTDQGITDSFRVIDHPEVIWRSGSYAIPLSSPKAMRDAAEASAAEALTAASEAGDSAAAAEATAGEVEALRQWVELGVTRRNYCENPRALGRVWGKAGSTGTEDRVLTGGPLGLGYQRYTPSTTTTTSPISLMPQDTGANAALVVPGRTYTFSAYQRALGQPTAMNMGILVTWYDAAGAVISSDSTYQGNNPGVWTRYAKTLVAPAGAVFAIHAARFSITAGQVAVSGELGSDHFQIEESEAASDYFDGDLAPTTNKGYRWSGTANASVSEMIDMSAISSDLVAAAEAAQAAAEEAAEGVPLGGSTGQVLTKASNADRDTVWVNPSSGGSTTDHNTLANLTVGDPHTQYHNDTRGDARYYTKSQVDTMVNNAASQNSAADRNRSNHSGTQAISTITGLQAILDGLGGTAVNSVAGKTGAVVLVSSDISDTGSVGREVMGATSQGAARTSIGAAASSHTHPSTGISDSTPTGRALMTAASDAAARSAIGAGVSNLSIGTTGTTAMRGNAIVINPSSTAGLPDGTLIARTA